MRIRPCFGAILRRKKKVMATFQKREDCPASQELLAYQLGDVEGAQSRAIGKHLANCEFCSAEVDFYERYPQRSEEPEESSGDVSIPEPLFELAEALLNKKSAERSMERMINELETPAERSR